MAYVRCDGCALEKNGFACKRNKVVERFIYGELLDSEMYALIKTR